MSTSWDPATAGVLELPSGRRIRGRPLRVPLRDDLPHPEFGLYLLRRQPEHQPAWSWRWLRWPDFRLPTDRVDALDAFTDVWRRSADHRVEISCWGGHGRTGTALACLAVLDGLSPAEAVRLVREDYYSAAIETPWQRRFISRFTASAPVRSAHRRP